MFELTGLPPAPRGVPQVEVTFDIDANGIVNVHAKDLATNKEQGMTITGGSGLSKDEIDRMMKDAEAHADEDKKRRDEAEVRNTAEGAAVHRRRSSWPRTVTSCPRTSATELQDALEELKKQLEGADYEAIKAAQEKLSASSSRRPVAPCMPPPRPRAEGDAGAEGFTPGAARTSPSRSPADDDTVVDAEVVDEGPAELCRAK